MLCLLTYLKGARHGKDNNRHSRACIAVALELQSNLH